MSPEEINPEEKNLLADLEDLKECEDPSGGYIISLGSPFTKEEIEEENKKDDEKKDAANTPQNHVFDEFYINSRRPRLRSIASRVVPSGDIM